MNCKGRKRSNIRHVLLAMQILSFLILLLMGRPIQPLSTVLYCLAAFSSPLLLFLYGRKYYSTERFWLLDGIPFFVEIMIVYLFGGSMIYGIYVNDRSSILFMWLFVALVIDVAVCTVFKPNSADVIR